MATFKFHANRLSLDKLRRRTSLVWISAAVVISLCIFVSAIWMSPLATYIWVRRPPMPAQLAVLSPEEARPVSPKRAYLRAGGISTEGLGVCGGHLVLFSVNSSTDFLSHLWSVNSASLQTEHRSFRCTRLVAHLFVGGNLRCQVRNRRLFHVADLEWGGKPYREQGAVSCHRRAKDLQDN
ncbi:hypothetical protein B0H12DRAFT_106313 [Mycena haematopus]|nr:hypothetical protein B0H12DRAFT_106313 [Mycena haematopus]